MISILQMDGAENWLTAKSYNVYKTLNVFSIKQKRPEIVAIQGVSFLLRGRERIRTAVRAFAELCLATRPKDPTFNPPAADKELIQFQQTLY